MQFYNVSYNYGHALAKNPCPRGHGIYNFGRPFHGYDNYAISLTEPCHRVEKNTFYEMHQFYTFYPKTDNIVIYSPGKWKTQ